MRMPKLPPNAADYGYQVYGGHKCFLLVGEIIRLDCLAPMQRRQFAACMEAGWRRQADLRWRESWEDKHILDADNHAQEWSDWSAKHAPTEKKGEKS